MAEQAGLVLPQPIERQGPGVLARAWRLARRKPLAAIALVILIALLIIGVGAPVLSPDDPLVPTRARLESPSNAHLLGTDELGRDVLSRAMWGARTSIITGFSVSITATLAGFIIGGLSGYLGGKFDLVVQRLVEAIQALPAIIIAMVLVTILGPKTWHNIPLTVIVALSVVLAPGATRVARSAALGVGIMPYVEAGRSMGGTSIHIFARHVAPNIVAPMLVVVTAALGNVILAEASLSFLGIGTPPPTPSWGGMVSGTARSHLRDAPWLALVPGLAITLAVLAFNFLGDGIRDLTDPRLRGSR